MMSERLSERLREAIQSSWWDDVVDDVKAILPALEELEAREERLRQHLRVRHGCDVGEADNLPDPFVEVGER